MILEELLKQTKAEKSSSLSNEHLVTLLNEVEAIVQDYLEIPSEERKKYIWPDDNDAVLIVAEPHSRLYMSYLKARIDFINEEYESYVNNQAQFEVDFQEFGNYASKHGLIRATTPTKITGWW